MYICTKFNAFIIFRITVTKFIHHHISVKLGMSNLSSGIKTQSHRHKKIQCKISGTVKY